MNRQQITEALNKMRAIAKKASEDTQLVIAEYDAQRSRTFNVTITDEHLYVAAIFVLLLIAGVLQ